jgi:flavodoxin
MRALVVYESLFGNTELIAQTIARALAGRVSVRVVPLAQACHTELETADLLVIGCPTQYHDATPDALAWLDHLPRTALEGMATAVFDTRYHMAQLLSGSAAQVIGKRIEQCGARLLAPPQSFFVVNRDGPLEAGEVERAAAWADVLLGAVEL